MPHYVKTRSSWRTAGPRRWRTVPSLRDQNKNIALSLVKHWAAGNSRQASDYRIDDPARWQQIVTQAAALAAKPGKE